MNESSPLTVFFGAAIQGARDRAARSDIHRRLIETIKSLGCHVLSEHTGGSDFDQTAALMEDTIGPLPDEGKQRTVYVRDEMIRMVESAIDAAIFEVSTPSLGTGIEIAHAYLRPRLSLSPIPVIALYQKNYWPNHLSAMIDGISKEKVPHFTLLEYEDMEHAAQLLDPILSSIKPGGQIPASGTISARKCPCCGHHEIGMTAEDGSFRPLRPGMDVEIK